jgi:hypothetical protein
MHRHWALRLGHILACAAVLWNCAGRIPYEAPEYDYSGMDKLTRNAHKRVEKFVRDTQKKGFPFPVSPLTKIDSLKVDKDGKSIELYFDKVFSFPPFRPKDVEVIYAGVQKRLGRKFRKYEVSVRALEQPIEQLVPNIFRPSQGEYDFSRMPASFVRTTGPIVQNLSRPFQPPNGLFNRNIVLWHSHGWYFNLKKDRWEWQRPRLFQTVEDLLPLSFTLPYLIPMLENAGANVFIPRERDTQINEFIVDNDTPIVDSLMIHYAEESGDSLHAWQAGDDFGFALGNPPYPVNYNPFFTGTFKFALSDTIGSAHIEWIPDIAEAGSYGVYVSYATLEESISDAKYVVDHDGGTTEFIVNQKMGGGTWIYLGRFKFRQGFNPTTGKVLLTNKSGETGKVVTADAVRFGGGMGIIERNGRTSGRPRFMEGARYYLQFAGMPDTLVYDLNESIDDYKDDYQSRAEFGNYLRGAPSGPNKDRSTKGLGIPIDMSLAFHTDAGITRNDTTIGTLSIYSIVDADTEIVFFPGGMSRLANRDLADIMQTQIVDDFRSKYDPAWRRRALLEAQYSEATRPNVPAMLLELLSHQNFLDMKFALDPRFRFDASRSIYKGLLEFISFQNRYDHVVQPLPVTHFYAEFSDSAQVTLRWRPRSDPLEPLAVPDNYILYTRRNEEGFDNGVLVNDPEIALSELEEGVIFSFQVSALNRGGESFPSEILSVCWTGNEAEPALIINGFDRICGPAALETPGVMAFLDLDKGVADRFDFNFTGRQFDFLPESGFRTNDAPGHGASYADFETRIIPGNTFDFPLLHGKSLLANGRSFVSASDEAIMDSLIDVTQFHFVDLILGEEKQTPWPKAYTDSLLGVQFTAFPEELKKQIVRYLDSGGNLFVSGAYVGTDLFENKPEEHPDVLFGQNVLKIQWQTNHAARSGGVFTSDSLFAVEGESFIFNTGYDPKIYEVEAPDAIDPFEGATTILRYRENHFSAATAFKGQYGIVVFGFPFETIIAESDRIAVMKAILEFLEREPVAESANSEDKTP